MKIVLAYDGSDYARKALLFALKLMRDIDELHMVTVVKEIPRSPEQVTIENDKKAEEALNAVKKEIEGYKVVTKVLESADVPSAIIDYCNKIECDLIVTGSRGLTGIKKIVLGSVSSELVSRSNIPVLVVK
ncbi:MULTISPECIES: universal stress protein [Metallosphaera]|uniref:UspA domain protein n=3 Tax=Metallosphaera TaxID=41980 RepID=A4YDC8_METS5|nr:MULTISPECIES: universal stress protein [Metallosphaera]ABP94430.1 UspA domain protein [Metallosphaera sedula DSM 5348]AIM26417.1 UspA domain protein [Metallosphaera sedula]AKV73419.1 universal stress protein UspA [Metallosphaera sedula]AKV75662.1 universal stress protein UspA [Metallosphaera sedula]AKV77908.1 universal stress protein UspA [Metallosphaera sedula]